MKIRLQNGKPRVTLFISLNNVESFYPSFHFNCLPLLMRGFGFIKS